MYGRLNENIASSTRIPEYPFIIIQAGANYPI
jgi:hypothetical protein